MKLLATAIATFLQETVNADPKKLLSIYSRIRTLDQHITLDHEITLDQHMVTLDQHITLD